ncbi:hypothetical protein RUM43_006740 [Polyplax serrata]|uniref:Uncharacterized protein n=1 Tax=Polyplax serrata TaxID=468196 RepID=A0AAN8Q5A4_POLSC
MSHVLPAHPMKNQLIATVSGFSTPKGCCAISEGSTTEFRRLRGPDSTYRCNFFVGAEESNCPTCRHPDGSLKVPVIRQASIACYQEIDGTGHQVDLGEMAKEKLKNQIPNEEKRPDQ